MTKVGNLEIPENLESLTTVKLENLFYGLKKRYYRYHAKGAREQYIAVTKILQARGKVSTLIKAEDL